MAKAPKATKGAAGAKVAAAAMAGLLGGVNPFANLPGQVRLNEMRPTPMTVPPRTTPKRKGK